MANVTIPVIMVLIGMLAWFVFSTKRLANAKLAETGRMMVFAGLLGFALAHAHETVTTGSVTVGR